MFSIIAFIVMGVVCLLASYDFFNSYKANPLLGWALVGTAVLCFIGAELSSIWLRILFASQASSAALDRQTELLRSIASNLPNAVAPTDVESEPSTES